MTARHSRLRFDEEAKQGIGMATLTIKNGVDVGQLVQTIDAIKEHPSEGTFTFRAKSSWVDGTHNVGEVAGFTYPTR